MATGRARRAAGHGEDDPDSAIRSTPLSIGGWPMGRKVGGADGRRGVVAMAFGGWRRGARPGVGDEQEKDERAASVARVEETGRGHICQYEIY